MASFRHLPDCDWTPALASTEAWAAYIGQAAMQPHVAADIAFLQ